MAQTHMDDDAQNEWFQRLNERADEAVAKGLSKIASEGFDTPLARYKAHGVDVRQLEDDEQGILRISVGGADLPHPFIYCTFRGPRQQCALLLRAALAALETGKQSDG